MGNYEISIKYMIEANDEKEATKVVLNSIKEMKLLIFAIEDLDSHKTWHFGLKYNNNPELVEKLPELETTKWEIVKVDL